MPRNTTSSQNEAASEIRVFVKEKITELELKTINIMELPDYEGENDPRILATVQQFMFTLHEQLLMVDYMKMFILKEMLVLYGDEILKSDNVIAKLSVHQILQYIKGIDITIETFSLTAEESEALEVRKAKWQQIYNNKSMAAEKQGVQNRAVTAPFIDNFFQTTNVTRQLEEKSAPQPKPHCCRIC